MARFAGTKRQQYTSERVRKMRMERALVKAKKDGVSDSQVQHYLGKLQAAGHMRVNGFRSMNVEQKVDNNDTLSQSLGLAPGVLKSIKLEYQLYNPNGMDDKPHFDGYLRSASEVDKQYRLKGWFNEDGTIRLELVN
jgi:hypothetical protein